MEDTQERDDSTEGTSPQPIAKYIGIKTLVHKITDETTASFTGSDSDKKLIYDAMDKLNAFEVISEEDRFEYLFAFCEMLKHLIEKFPNDREIEEMKESYQKFNSLIHYFYGSDSLYSKANSILYEMINNISKQGDEGGTFDIAIQKFTDLHFKIPEDDAIRLKVFAQITAVKLAYEWFLNAPADDMIEEPFEIEFAHLLKSVKKHGFNKNEILITFYKVEEIRKNFTGDFMLLSITLLRIYGLGILLAPQNSPALEEIEDRVIELSQQYFKQYYTAFPKQGSIPRQKSAEEIISEFTALVQKDGTSPYAFDQASIAIQQLPQTTEEEFLKFQTSYLQIIDIGIAHSRVEQITDSLKIVKENFVKTLEMVDNPPEPLTSHEIEEILKQNLSEVKQNIEKGETPETAISRAFLNVNSLMMSMPEDDKEGGTSSEIIIKFMANDLMELLGKYSVPEAQQAIWKELMKTMDLALEPNEWQGDNEFDKAMEQKRFDEQGARTINAGLHLPANSAVASIPHVKQLNELFPGLFKRLDGEKIDDNTYDRKEYDRFTADLNDSLRLLSSSYTLELLMQHQKVSFRRIAIELSLFERRRCLMLASPVFIASEIIVDPNRIFFSGTEDIVTLLINSCDTLGMVIASNRIISNKLNSRWEQMRSSAIAIFDYTTYNPPKADPMEPIVPGSVEETEMLEAASLVATVAYETGWAYALGKPVVILTKKGKPIPFDIDIEAVVLEGDEKDEERIIAGIQTALYGVNRNPKGSCLSETVDYVKEAFKEAADEKVKSLIQSLNDTGDATKVRFTIETILDRMRQKNRMVITPAFPGGYPDKQKKKVFHVTAFRKWSKPLEEELKRICTLKGLEYKIGYEELNPEILPSIWQDISEASYVIADITTLNPNATLELAMAQVLGSRILILTQTQNSHPYFYPIQKTRCHLYNPNESKQELTELLESFFDNASR